MAQARVDRFDLAVSDLGRSLASYRALLGPLGCFYGPDGLTLELAHEPPATPGADR